LTNLIPAASDNQHAKFRVPLNILEDAIPELGAFPYERGDRTWDGKTLLIKGSKSKYAVIISSDHFCHINAEHSFRRYVNHQNIPLTAKFFPKMRLETIEAGHWGLLFTEFSLLQIVDHRNPCYWQFMQSRE
jgi:hypothetical protein